MNAAVVVLKDDTGALLHYDDLLNHIFDPELQFLDIAADDLPTSYYYIVSNVISDSVMVDINASLRVPVGKVYCNSGNSYTKFFDAYKKGRRHKSRFV